MPTDAELRQLFGVVYAKYPRLDPRKERDHNADRHARATRLTFWAVGQLGRLPEPEAKNVKSLTWWADYCTDILRGERLDHDVTPGMFAAAALAHGDVPHTITARWPFDVSFGLTYQHAGTPAGAAWRRVVLTGALRPASDLPPLGENQAQPGWRNGQLQIDPNNVQIGLIGTRNW
jgi:hypothetical protein